MKKDNGTNDRDIYQGILEREIRRLSAINMQLEEKLAAVKEQRDFARQQLISTRVKK